MSQVAYQARAYFNVMKHEATRCMSTLPPSGWNASPLHGYPGIKFAGSCLYTTTERGTMREKCLA